jgi:GNAT superfamily N-acetyltransferase
MGMALIEAARLGDEEAVYELLVAGAPANARDRPTGGTALHVAAAADQLDAVSALVGWVPVNRRALDSQGRTAFAVARHGSPVAAVLEVCGLGEPRPPLGDAHGELAWATDIALLAHIGRAPGVETRLVGDGFAVRTGLQDNTRNGVVCSRLGHDDDVDELLAWLASVPALWYVGADVDPPDLRERLQRAGCEAERAAVHMVVALDDIDAARAADVVEVFDAAPLVAHYDADEAALLVAAGRPLRHFVIGDVGAITTFVAGRTLLGLQLHVAPQHRRRGIARALVRHALTHGRDDGCTHAVLAPTPSSIAFYERLGFALERSLPDREFYLPFDDDAGEVP